MSSCGDNNSTHYQSHPNKIELFGTRNYNCLFLTAALHTAPLQAGASFLSASNTDSNRNIDRTSNKTDQQELQNCE